MIFPPPTVLLSLAIIEAVSGFDVYWNVPTFQCHKYNMDFSEVNNTWLIQQNTNDNFRGEKVAILYDPGVFPALLDVPSGPPVPQNGGVPQAGSIKDHLNAVQNQVARLIPNTNFDGLGVLDFEHWRPIWRQNWATLTPYKEFSREIERRRHPFWFKSMIETESIYRFELYARMFMMDTLDVVKRLRPKAKWGYYGYPFCFNYTPGNDRASCSAEVVYDNNRTDWLWVTSGAIYPSLYLRFRDMTPSKRLAFMDGRLEESIRAARGRLPIYPYIWYKYHDTRKFLTQEDMFNTLLLARERGLPGVVIWGASNDVNTEARCQQLREYLATILGPSLAAVRGHKGLQYLVTQV